MTNIKLSDYPKQIEFHTQEELEETIKGLTLKLKDGNITKFMLEDWQRKNRIKYSLVDKATKETLKLQNAIYDELLNLS